jgi:flagellar biosynthesis component FlhA
VPGQADFGVVHPDPQRACAARGEDAPQIRQAIRLRVAEIRLSDDLSIPPKAYQIKIHGTMVASEELRIGDVLVITGDGPRPDMPCDEAREPAFGMKAVRPEMFVNDQARGLRRSTTCRCC